MNWEKIAMKALDTLDNIASDGKMVLGLIVNILLAAFIVANNPSVEGVLAGIFCMVAAILLILFLNWIRPNPPPWDN